MAKFGELIQSETPVVVDFSAEWCGPCKMMVPILHQVKDEMKDDVKILKIDTDRNPRLAEKFSIRGVPTLMIFRNGQSVWRQSGVVSANDLVRTIRQYSAN